MTTTKIKELISGEKRQYSVLFALSLGVMGMTGIIYFSNHSLFQRFIGGQNPLTAAFFILLLGLALLSFLLSKGWFTIFKKENLKGLFRRSGPAALFAAVAILVDLKFAFPADMNVLFPESLLFYPAIGFYAEILFHVLPLAALLLTLTSIFKNARYENIAWICILMVALLEPAFQLKMGTPNHFPPWAAAVVWLNIFLFNFYQLFIFKRCDFISMYSFRLAYYVFWHIGWGFVRLKLLF